MKDTRNDAYVRVKINAVLLTTLFTAKNDTTYQDLGQDMHYSEISFELEPLPKFSWLELYVESVVVSGAADYSLW